MAYVLIIDDDEDFASAVATVLREEGYETALEYRPDAVLARMQERRPDAIVLDVMFPENPSAGFELARVIRRTWQDLPILMLTAVNQQFPLGFSSRDIDPTWLPITEFVEKPVDFQVLCEKMRTLCGSGRRA